MNYLSPRGYVLHKDNLDEAELTKIKNELTVVPFTPEGYGAKPEAFKTYMESNNKLYVPKAYGLTKFGAVSKSKIYQGDDINIEFKGSLRPKQIEAVNEVIRVCKDEKYMGGILSLNCGEGKCLAKDTPILMFDGTIKMVQDVTNDDVLMGDDSLPRHVLSIARGYETMYRIEQECGDYYTVNESHILSLINIKNKSIVDISLLDYISLSENLKKNLYGYKVPIEFTYKEIIEDPYIIGLMSSESGVIPHIYKCNSREIRMKVFKGILDKLSGSINSTGFEVCLRNPLQQEDFLFLARSLGYACHIHHNNNNINIIGSTSLITPIKIHKFKVDSYYGFEIDGNKRFVLGDFTVTHNTICAIYTICQLKKKTLIIVHKEFLLQQWRERIAEFAPDARIGCIKAKVIDVDNKDIVIASLQSLAMKDYDESVLNTFGNVVVDECHHMSAQVFSQALKKVNFRYSLGLSATPKRKDGLTKVYKWFLGDIIYTSKKRTDEVVVSIKDYYDANPMYSQEHKLWTKKPNVSKMINAICEYAPRTQYIINLIKDILQDEPERRILILSDRRQHIKDISTLLDKNGIENGFYYGGLSESELKESEKKRIVLGTYQFANEGLDISGLNTLILASPKSDVIQVTGRILRDKPESRKYVPLIIDIIDNFSIFVNQGKKRIDYYKKCKYTIEGVKESPKKKILSLNECHIVDLE